MGGQHAGPGVDLPHGDGKLCQQVGLAHAWAAKQDKRASFWFQGLGLEGSDALRPSHESGVVEAGPGSILERGAGK